MGFRVLVPQDLGLGSLSGVGLGFSLSPPEGANSWVFEPRVLGSSGS